MPPAVAGGGCDPGWLDFRPSSSHSRGHHVSTRNSDADPRRGTNPLFNDRKLKLGTFCTNLDYGAAISTIDGTLRISWPATLSLAKLAEEMEFEALVPVG